MINELLKNDALLLRVERKSKINDTSTFEIHALDDVLHVVADFDRQITQVCPKEKQHGK